MCSCLQLTVPYLAVAQIICESVTFSFCILDSVISRGYFLSHFVSYYPKKANQLFKSIVEDDKPWIIYLTSVHSFYFSLAVNRDPSQQSFLGSILSFFTLTVYLMARINLKTSSFPHYLFYLQHNLHICIKTSLFSFIFL